MEYDQYPGLYIYQMFSLLLKNKSPYVMADAHKVQYNSMGARCDCLLGFLKLIRAWWSLRCINPCK